MKNALRILLILGSCSLFLGQAQTLKPGIVPKNDPNGTWESPSGTKYNLRLSGEKLVVSLAGANPPFLQYEMTLAQDKDDVNRYTGTGFFRATLKSGKECRFETNWDIVVITLSSIVGNAPRFIEPDPQTCTPKETAPDRLELKKK